MTADYNASRPKLVLFRWTRAGLSSFLLGHLSEHLRTLNLFFDVVLIDEDCDYDRVCDEHKPDLCVFESGVYAGHRSISSTDTHPDIPKLGFLHADPFDSSRAAFIADMSRWGVQWFFTTSMSMAEYTPDIADRLFVWPNAVDTTVFRDYGLEKNIPILLTGSQARHYPWRNSVSQIVAAEFPTMTMPHFGWNAERGTNRMLQGVQYARMLSSSVFVPTCGTFARDVVRKHLEIPAAGAALVTEDTPSIRAFGFEDMVNCVFADAASIAPKLQLLFDSPEMLTDITKAGLDLVHSHHGLQARSQVSQWLELVREHGPEMRLHQDWPSGDLTVLAADAPLDGPPSGNAGRDRPVLTKGWSAVSNHDGSAAESAFLRCLNYYFIPEAAVGMVFARLIQGDAAGADSWVFRLLAAALNYHLAPEPDPVQWACEIRVLLCQGDVRAALAAAGRYPGMGHPELDRMRQAVRELCGASNGIFTTPMPSARPSIHRLPEIEDATWRRQLADMLAACGQRELASALTRKALIAHASRDRIGAGTRGIDTRIARLRAGVDRSVTERWLRRKLSPLRRQPVADAWAQGITRLVESEPLTIAVIVESERLDRTAASVYAGLRTNPSLPPVLTVRPRRARQRPGTKEISSMQAAMARLVEEPGGLVYLSGRGADLVGDASVLDPAAIVVLEGTTAPHGYEILNYLLDERGFALVAHDPERGLGCAVLRRPFVNLSLEEREDAHGRHNS